MAIEQKFHRFGSWQILVKVTNVLCSDGKTRTFWATGEPDTFFTQPGRVKVNGKTVTGHIYHDSMYDDEENYPDGVWKFSAYTYRKNHDMLPEWPSRKNNTSSMGALDAALYGSR